jgi:ribosomal-protein-alanine N-acetyltransferase
MQFSNDLQSGAFAMIVDRDAKPLRNGRNVMFFTNIETERLLLKNISQDDREFIFNQFSNDYIIRFLFDAEPVTDIAGADDIISFYCKPEPRHEHRWILHLKQNDQTIGTCGFHCWNPDEGSVEVGYDLLEPYTGQGYMNEALKAIIEFAKTRMNIRVINACIYTENTSSINLAMRNGFVLTGATKYEVFRGEKYLHNIYALVIG